MLRSNIVQIGRGTDCDIVLQSSKVSKKHAIVYAEDGVLYIEDTQSANGTFLNSKKVIGKVKIEPGSSVVFGDERVDMAMLASKINYVPPVSPQSPGIGEVKVVLPPSQPAMHNCPHCGVANPTDRLECLACGQPVHEKKMETSWALFVQTQVENYLPAFRKFADNKNNSDPVAKMAWSWPGFFFNVLWLAYRKMYLASAIYGALFALLFSVEFLLIVKHSAVARFIPVGNLILAVFVGLFGKFIYYNFVNDKLKLLRESLQVKAVHTVVLDRNGGTSIMGMLGASLLLVIACMVTMGGGIWLASVTAEELGVFGMTIKNF